MTILHSTPRFEIAVPKSPLNNSFFIDVSYYNGEFAMLILLDPLIYSVSSKRQLNTLVSFFRGYHFNYFEEAFPPPTPEHFWDTFFQTLYQFDQPAQEFLNSKLRSYSHQITTHVYQPYYVPVGI